MSDTRSQSDVSSAMAERIRIIFQSGPPPGYDGPPPGHPQFEQYAAMYIQSYTVASSEYSAQSEYQGGHPLKQAGKYDGPGSQVGSGPPGTPVTQSPRFQPASPAHSSRPQPGSPAQMSVGRPNPFPPGPGYDPARTSGATQQKVITNTRCELPAAAYAFASGLPDNNLNRPAYNTASGRDARDVQVRVNQFKVTQWPQKDVYQYDVFVGNGAEKPGTIKAVWASQAVQRLLRQASNGNWLFDGNALAWCSVPMNAASIEVNLDQERGRKPRDRPDIKSFRIRCTKTIRMAVLEGYLSGKMAFDNSILEAINFLDHLWRQWPSQQYTLIRRSFFMRGANTTALDNCIVALKGVYSSIRLCSPRPSLGGPGTGLAINVDVANGTFWTAQDVHQAARNYCSIIGGRRALDYHGLRDVLAPLKNNSTGKFSSSEAFVHLNKMSKLRFTVKHRGKEDNTKLYTIQGFSKAQAQGGAHAKNTTFLLKEENREISVFDYYRKKYNIELQYWFLPLVETTRDGKFPMELCTLVSNQKYQYKLNPEQTQAMIKFAVTRPPQRLQSIQNGINMLKWQQDPNLLHYGVKIDQNLTLTKAKVLAPPEVEYSAKSKATPGYSGRWDLRGKKFLFANNEPLKSWGVGVIGECLSEADTRNFMNLFIQTYVGHGGRIENKNPVIFIGKRGQDLADVAVNARKAAGDQSRMLPQIMFYVLSGRDSFMYQRLKKNSECRFGLVTQMMQVNHVRKCQPQYCSNVAMKVNAKLGGASCKAFAPKPFFNRPTMIIGSDVSHAGPGSDQPSVAALTMSFDTVASRYAAAVQTNGYRVEMITEANINTMMMPLFNQWMKRVNGGNIPQHIYYFRDGVSEGQFSKVINEEVAQMKQALIAKYPDGSKIRWTVIVCTKRHHIRIFPKDGDNQAGDKNGNPLPGTLVEHDVTHPFEYDFYLSSHSAIQGTARPVHYQVLLDEAQVPVNELQKLIYQHCYQYMRSTTPVSIFPAVYYAHLASNRAACHDPSPSSEGPKGGQKFDEMRGQISRTGSSGRDKTTDAPPLLPLGDTNSVENVAIAVKIRTTMWYI